KARGFFVCENNPVEIDELARGIECFNRGEFFAAHELLEDVWRAAPQENKKFFQGLVQVAVAFHHHSTGNFVGMRSVLERAMRNLIGRPGALAEFDRQVLWGSRAEWRRPSGDGLPRPPLPQIKQHKGKA